MDRARQIATCLDAAHSACPRYVAAMQVRDEQMPWAPPSPDSGLVTTRLVMAPDSMRHALVSAGARARTRRWAAGAALAAIGLVAVTGGVLGALGSLRPSGEAAAVATTPAASDAGTETPAIGGRLLTGSPQVNDQPSAAPETTPSPRPSAQPGNGGPPARRSYVVREGDTLGDIAKIGR